VFRITSPLIPSIFTTHAGATLTLSFVAQIFSHRGNCARSLIRFHPKVGQVVRWGLHVNAQVFGP
jgi:hypothetical protein